MGATNRVTVDVYDAQGRHTGRLTVALPGKAEAGGNPAPLVDLRHDPARDPALEPLQLVEDGEYRYTFCPLVPTPAPIRLDPEDLFSPDGADWLSGRLRPGFATGTMAVTIRTGAQELGRVAFEVRSRKLDYVSQYRWMLADIADCLAALVMERFAATEQRFASAAGASAQTLYQQFAFLKGLFSGSAFAAAIQQIRAYPHRAWVEETELRRPGQPIPVGAGALRHLQRPGPRVPWPGLGAPAPLPTLPAWLPVTRTAESLDTPENRFVKFALQRWRGFTAAVEQALRKEAASAPVQRGLREVQAVQGELNAILAAEVFAGVGDLTYFPASSPVLHQRAGYRDLYRAYIQFEAAALLTWDGGADVYGAGQRDVATLYEYWVFFQLVRVLERLCQREFDRTRLLERRPDGLGVSLRRGRPQGLAGSITRLGRPIRLELWFNHTFPRGAGDRASWSRSLRPDYSLLIQPAAAYGEAAAIWLHFDAKYRVEGLAELFGTEPAPAQEGASARAADLLKMHAYRDAIRRSAGAYVLYPGSERELLPMFHELLPGLGAFPLRPTADGTGTGADELCAFIDAVITHVATQASQHERLRFWVREATHGEYRAAARPAAPFLARPPADTPVLLGYVRGPGHWAWIQREWRYNLRADPARRGSVGIDAWELAAEFVLLYGPAVPGGLSLWRVAGAPEVYTEERMRAGGYPAPRGAYFCLPLAPVPAGPWLQHLRAPDLERLRAARRPGSVRGQPVAVTWLDLVQGPD